MSDLISDYSTNTQPIEGRPELNVDWNQIYLSERRTRLADSIDEYLQDDKTDARQTYEEILSCVQEVMNYHKKEYSIINEKVTWISKNRTINLSCSLRA